MHLTKLEHFCDRLLRRPSIKDVRSQGGWLYSAGILRTRGEVFSDADVRSFWRKKFEFFEIYGVSVRTKGFEPVRTFADKGGGEGGQFLAILF